MTDKRALEQADARDYAEAWDELEDVSSEFADVRPKKDRQLNLRVDSQLLAALRTASARSGEGYHSFARRLIEEGLARALEPEPGESKPDATETPNLRPFRVKELLLVLLGQPGPTSQLNEPIVGKTRLQKLLFLAAQHLKGDVAARFEAYSYGPFEEAIEPDLEFLASEGLVEWEGRGPEIPQLQDESERGARIVDWVRSRAEAAPRPVESYRLTQLGLEWVRRFFASDAFGSPEAKQRLADECRRLKEEFARVPLDELVDFVYAEFPEFTKGSRIRHQVAERRERRLGRRRAEYPG